MAERADESAGLEDELTRCLEELSVVRQSWQASEMSLKVQSESVERLTTQVQQLSDELHQAREQQNAWRTRAEEARVKMERLLAGGAGVSEYQQQVATLEAALAEATRLRRLDSEKIAAMAARLEGVDDLDRRVLEAGKAVAAARREADEWRRRAEAHESELLAWRSKSEAWEASKAQTLRSLQQERDRLQGEWQVMRQSLQSAEASLAVQTAGVQRLEQEVVELEGRLLDAERLREGHVEKEEQWRVEVLTLRTRMESEFGTRDRRIEELQAERAHLRADAAELRMGLQSAEASLAVQTAVV